MAMGSRWRSEAFHWAWAPRGTSRRQPRPAVKRSSRQASLESRLRGERALARTFLAGSHGVIDSIAPKTKVLGPLQPDRREALPRLSLRVFPRRAIMSLASLLEQIEDPDPVSRSGSCWSSASPQRGLHRRHLEARGTAFHRGPAGGRPCHAPFHRAALGTQYRPQRRAHPRHATTRGRCAASSPTSRRTSRRPRARSTSTRRSSGGPRHQRRRPAPRSPPSPSTAPSIATAARC